MTKAASSENLSTRERAIVEASYVSALAALAGSAVGGLTSFATAWLGQQIQTRNARRTQELNKREMVYGEFIDEVSKRFGEALESEHGTVSNLVTLYSQVSRMQLFAPRSLIEEAHKVLNLLIATYAAPVRNFTAYTEGEQVDPLREFSRLSRCDLETFYT